VVDYESVLEDLHGVEVLALCALPEGEEGLSGPRAGACLR